MLQQRDDKDRRLSDTCYTSCLMYLLKANDLAREFVDQRGFEIMQKFLQNQAINDGQIAYNVITALWIISYHHFALKGFEDFSLMIIELVSKILNYFNKEKIVRVICMLFNNLKDSTVCLEHLSMINALNIIIKLQNRPWVDKDIEDKLQALFVFFDSNYKEFSSFDKWRRQVQQRQLCWSPVHTEKFWQTNFIYFHEADNMKLIDILCEVVANKQNNDTILAVACYDLGEFARFFPTGKIYLENQSVKAKIAELMAQKESSAELKKEAITC